MVLYSLVYGRFNKVCRNVKEDSVGMVKWIRVL